jgi:hypothetical protein
MLPGEFSIVEIKNLCDNKVSSSCRTMKFSFHSNTHFPMLYTQYFSYEFPHCIMHRTQLIGVCNILLLFWYIAIKYVNLSVEKRNRYKLIRFYSLLVELFPVVRWKNDWKPSDSA